jgi:peptide-methionine (R)-S-oxide reductase
MRYPKVMNRTTSRTAFIATLGGLGALAFTSQLSRSPARAAQGRYAVVLTDEQWRGRLKPDAYAVLRHEATESAFSSPLDEEKRPGTYACAGCDLRLYDAKTKFDSGTGWPSFYAPLPHAIATKTDYSMGIPRTEVHCSRCGGHLGHVFDDGPQPTGLRYCMNGVALVFHAATKA